ncbi:MAG: hypothetical protein FH756_17390 [Firmicutes bacterium]|nr:hypothetical protein [Bacillota bacterium]
MKKILKACLAVIAVTFMALSLSYYLYLRSAIQIINKVPPAFNKQLLVFSEGGVAVVHDNKMLHIINKSNQPLMMSTLFKSYLIDKEKNEVVIRQNLLNPKPRNNTYQLIKIPHEDYSRILSNNKLLIRVKYAFLGKQHTLFEYDLSNKSLKLTQEYSIGK